MSTSRRLCEVLLAFVLASGRAIAQDHQHGTPAPPSPPQQQGQAGHDQHVDHSQHLTPSSPLFPARDASGTAWVPATTPMFGVHRAAGAWDVMLHGTAFAQFLYEGGEEHRRSKQAGSINWFMAMARRPAGEGRAGVRAMLSLEPWTIAGCGYPDLLATGETCDGDTIHDRQHPHDLFMELAAEYDRPLTGALRWQLYAGLAGEPALGPPGFPHRLSAMPNPIAPMGHHWLDATHITFGVVTAGVYNARWKAEASLFNGREPDERRYDLDLAPLDSFAGRVTFAPTATLALQVSAGHLNEAEAEHGSQPRVDVDRVTASGIVHRTFGGSHMWATTLGWGRNLEAGEASHSVFGETAVTFAHRHSWFGRAEIGGKPAHDLHVHESDEVFTVGKLQAGYVRYFAARSGLQPGIGGSLSTSMVPDALAPRYGGRVAPGFGVFLTVRPAAHGM